MATRSSLPASSPPGAVGTAKGLVFLTLEDETGPDDVIVTPKRVEQQAPRSREARFSSSGESCRSRVSW